MNGISCGNCQSYSRGHQRCLLGKALPDSIKGAVEMVDTMGADYLCPHLNAMALEKILRGFNHKHAKDLMVSMHMAMG